MLIETAEETLNLNESSFLSSSSELIKECKRAFYYIYLPPELGKGVFVNVFHWIIEANFKLILKLSIPPFSDNTWNYFLATMFPISGFALTLIAFRLFKSYLWGICFLASILLCVLIYNTSNSLSAPKYLPLLMLIAFLQSIQWMWLLSNITVEIFKLFIQIFSIQPAYIGITFIAAANSIGDIISNLTMTSLGYSVTAMTASFAGPMFNLMVGIGITMTRNIIESGKPLPFSFKDITDFSNGNMLIIITLLMQGIVLVILLFVLKYNG